MQGISPMGLCDPWFDSYFHSWKNHQNLDNKTQVNFCWKYLDHLQCFCKRWSQWAFLPPGMTLIYTTENLPTITIKTKNTNLGRLNWIQSINWRKQKWNNKTITLNTTFHKPVGRENMYVWFEYGPQKIC